MTYNRKESEKEKIYISKSLYCIAETNKILYINISVRRNIPVIPLGFAFY